MADKKPCPDCARPLDPRGLTNHLRQAHANAAASGRAGPPQQAPAVAVFADDPDIQAARKELELARLRRELRDVNAPGEVEDALAEVHARLEALEARIESLSDSEAVFLACFDRLSTRIASVEGRCASLPAWR